MNPLLPKSDLNRAASVPSTLPLHEKSPLHGSTAVQGLVTGIAAKIHFEDCRVGPVTINITLQNYLRTRRHCRTRSRREAKCLPGAGLETLGQLSQAFPGPSLSVSSSSLLQTPRYRTNRCSCMVLLSYRSCRCLQPGHWPLQSNYHHHQQSRHNRHLLLK